MRLIDGDELLKRLKARHIAGDKDNAGLMFYNMGVSGAEAEVFYAEPQRMITECGRCFHWDRKNQTDGKAMCEVLARFTDKDWFCGDSEGRPD